MTCEICSVPTLEAFIRDLRTKGLGYHRIHAEANQWYGVGAIGRMAVREHLAHMTDVMPLESIAQAVDNGEEVGGSWFEDRGLTVPEGIKWVAATVTETMPGGEKSWIRIRPEETEDRVEIRQAQPVNVKGKAPGLTIIAKGNWQNWMISPDAQFGYWKDSKGQLHTIHDESCFDLGHQAAQAIAQSDGLHGWLDLGDIIDLAAPSRHNPPPIDLHVDCLNLTWQRCAEEFARRRWAVGEEGEVVVLDANHTIRLRSKALNEMPYLVGMKRAGDPDEEYPVLSVPYLTRSRDYGVEWVSGWPSGYRLLNGNLAAFHSPAYGSKALDTARKISSLMHCSVVFGHIHRREHLAQAIQTTRHGARTMEIWSPGCWARTDGSLPSSKNTYNDWGDRMTAANTTDKVGYLGEQMDQGFSIAHVEVGGRERFSVEHVAIWSGWCQMRGQSFQSAVDVEGMSLEEDAA